MLLDGVLIDDVRDTLRLDKSIFGTTLNNGVEYYNVSCAFDIETSSFKINNIKQATMYIWQFGIGNHIIIGRTWDEYKQLITQLKAMFYLNEKRVLIVYVHNLSYEFQFIKHQFNFIDVFSVDMRKPVYAKTDGGILYKCSYILSGYSLSKLADNLVSHDVKKLVGDLDYSKIRNSITPLTDQELQYCINDIKVVIAYIDEQKQQYGNITKIPLTNTGRVRQYIRDVCYPRDDTKKYNEYKKLMSKLTLEPQEYTILKRAFMGGFTHANADYIGMVAEDVASYDFTSSYPTQMIAQQYPMSKGEYVGNVSRETLEELCKYYCCVFDIKITNLVSKQVENILSFSKCWGVKNPVVNNGRLYSADELYTTITDIDYYSLKQFYDFDIVGVGNLYKYKRGYLPKPIIEAILKFYNDKTKLKSVVGMETEYQNSKGMLNACYGMIVTDIARDTITFENDWGTEPVDLEQVIKQYNKQKRRFLFYPWGIWVTAYARRALYSGILECENDYIYSDTDSVKIMNKQNHEQYFNDYNNAIVNKLYLTLDYYNIPHDLIEPCDINGNKHLLGVWDYEGTYDKFKTLGSKRYLTYKNNKYTLTVSGINKNLAVDYLKNNTDDVFKAFNDNMTIPQGYNGKNTHTYIDSPMDGMITDYLGNTCEYHELSGIHLEECEYTMGISNAFSQFLKTFKNITIRGN